MITSIEIQNLRGIRHGKLDGLTQVTVFVGGNGSGKSTVLEAIGLSQAPDAWRAFYMLGDREWLGSGAIGAWFNNDTRPARVGVEMLVGGRAWPRSVEIKHGTLTQDDLKILGSQATAKHVSFELHRDAEEGRGPENWRAIVDDDGSVSFAAGSNPSSTPNVDAFAYSRSR